MKRIISIIIFLLPLNTQSQELTINWEIPYTPITISWGKESGFSYSVGGGINTKLGQFSISYVESLARQRCNTSEDIIIGDQVISSKDLLVVIRNITDNEQPDVVFQIRNGIDYEFTATGLVGQKFISASGMHILYVTNNNDYTIQFIDGRDKTKITKCGQHTTYHISEKLYRPGMYIVAVDRTCLYKLEWYTMNAAQSNIYLSRLKQIYIQKIADTQLTGYTEIEFNGKVLKGWVKMRDLKKVE